jgi:arginase
MHGMPVRFLMTHNYSEFPRLKPHQIMYVGLRSVEQQEWDFIHENNIQYITSDRCLRFTDSSYEKIKEFIEDRPLHLSLDVDSLDPSIMFSTGTSVSDGLLLCHFSRIIEYAKKLASPFFAIDIMEYNPTIGNAEEKSISKQTMKEIIQIVSHI